MYLSHLDSNTGKSLPLPRTDDILHPFTGFYLDYKHTQKADGDMFERLNKPAPIKGLVTTISKSPHTLNWVYVDRRTYQVKYGSRAACEGQILGPWDWTDDEIGVTLEGWEGFVAVEERKDTWALYYDRNDDGLRDTIQDKRVLRCSLERDMVGDSDDE